MSRIAHSVQQGTPEWHALRSRYFTASEAPVMMGASPYESRAELLRRKATGIGAEARDGRQALFDKGHAAEAAARALAEEDIGEDLYPVTITAEVDGLPLLASLDGLTMDDSRVWEHKLISERILEALRTTGEPPVDHCWQMEQQLLVSGAHLVHYVASDGTRKNYVTHKYQSRPERRAALIAGWKQFARDLAEYREQAPDAPKAEGKPVAGFGALVLRVEGRVVASNMEAFKAGAEAFLARLPKAEELRDDQDFADAEVAIKACAEAESRIKAAKDQAIAQMADVEYVLRTADEVAESIRQARLSLDRVVKARKEALRGELVADAVRRVREHYAAIAAELGGYAPGIPASLTVDMGTAIKGLKSFGSMRDKLAQAVANAKIAADELARRIRPSKALLEAAIAEHGNLWPDGPNLARTMEPEAVKGIIAARVAEQQERQRQREEAERQREEAERQRAEARRAAEEAQQAAAPRIELPNPPRAAETAAPMKLGDINGRLAPLALTQAGLSQLGFEPIGRDKNAALYRASDWAAICAAIVRHVQGLMMKEAA